jgi:hypothetical protein
MGMRINVVLSFVLTQKERTKEKVKTVEKYGQNYGSLRCTKQTRSPDCCRDRSNNVLCGHFVRPVLHPYFSKVSKQRLSKDISFQRFTPSKSPLTQDSA